MKSWSVTFFCLIITAGLVTYGVTNAFVWDEGFHLLAAQLINKGKTPYLDFCFPQTPLNAYLNAAVMRWSHDGWKATHVLAALCSAASVALMVQFICSRLRSDAWQIPAGLICAGFAGLNETVWKFATSAQAYGSGTLLAVAAFRVTLVAATRSSLVWSLAAGLLGGAAAACTLLTAPVTPVLMVWLWFNVPRSKRWAAATAFALGAAVPFVPVLLLGLRSPVQTWFNVVQYQAIFRRVNWPGVNAHDFDVFTTWYNDSTSLLLAILTLIAIWYLRRRMEPGRTRAEFALCGLVTLALAAYISTAHPTFQRYYVFAIPFVAVLATLGARVLSERLGFSHRPWLAVAVLGPYLLLGIVKYLFDDRESTAWSQYDKIAAKIKAVTPPGGLIYADEHIYFLLNITPPPAMEFSYSHKLSLPPAQERLFHIVSEKELDEQVRQGRFATVESCKDERIDEMQLAQLFPNQQDVQDCSIFWGPVRPLVPAKK